MKNEKFLIFFIILALFIGSVNAEDVDLEDSHIENETYVNDTVLNEKNQYENIDENESHVCSDDDLNSLELNTSGVVMSDNEYSCGAASFATVLNKMGINISLNESKDATKTTINGTTMNNIIYAAKTYNLTAYAINTNTANLKENFIVHMDIMGINHWSVVKEINNETIILADPDRERREVCRNRQVHRSQGRKRQNEGQGQEILLQGESLQESERKESLRRVLQGDKVILEIRDTHCVSVSCRSR